MSRQTSQPSSATLRSRWGNPTQNTTNNYPLPTSSKRITLTDLCPEEKAKIGELMTRMQKEKDANNQLQLENKQLREKAALLELELQEVQESLQQAQRSSSLIQQYQRAIHELEAQLEELKQYMPATSETASFGCQVATTMSNRQVQVCSATASKGCQTDEIQDDNSHSQALKSSRTAKSGREREQNQNEPMSSSSHKAVGFGGSITTKVPPRPPKQNLVSPNNKILTFEQLTHEVNRFEDEEHQGREVSDEEAEASQLAQAWLNVKKSSIEKMKRGLKKSKIKVASPSAAVKQEKEQQQQEYSSVAQSDSSYERYHNQLLEVYKKLQLREQAQQKTMKAVHIQEEQPLRNQQQKAQRSKWNKLAHSQSQEQGILKTKKTTERQIHRSGSNVQTQPAGDNTDGFDEEILNKLLKSNDFKASALLKASTYSNSSSLRDSRNGHMPSKPQRVQKVEAGKSSLKNKLQYYDADLLDIINSIQN